MGEGQSESAEGVFDLIYILTHTGLAKTAQSPEEALADYGGMHLSGEIEWFRIFRVNKDTQELEVLYSWGDMGKYHLSYAKRYKSDQPIQWALQFRSRQGHGEQYFPEEHHMWCIFLSLLVSDPSIQLVAWRISQKSNQKEHLGQRFSTRNYTECRVNGMRAFFE